MREGVDADEIRVSIRFVARNFESDSNLFQVFYSGKKLFRVEEEFFKLRTVQFSNLRIFLYVKFFHSGKNYLKKYISNRGIF